LKLPAVVKLKLDQIDVQRPSEAWCAGLHHLPESIPTVRPAALDPLQLMQPLVVAHVGPITRSQSDRRYRLVAGRRTLQLLLEQYPRNHMTWALCLADEKGLPSEPDLEVLDTLLFKLICRPDGDDLALIAAELKENEVLRSAAGKYVDVTSDAAIGSLVGMSRAGLHRSVSKRREHLERLQEQTSASVKLELLPTSPVSSEAPEMASGDQGTDT
jgi:hypothetical protein